MSVHDFKRSCKTVSDSFSKADKRAHSLANLKNGASSYSKQSLVKETWLPCYYPGVPCDNRIISNIEPNSTDKGKKLIVVCSGLKCNLCLNRPKLQ
jgi:hypothetical protein